MAVLRKIFGRISWTPPDWAARLGLRRFLIGLATIAALSLLVIAGIAYYESLPKPAAVVVSVDPPGITPIVDDRLRPEPVSLRFKVRPDPRMPLETVDSVARIDLVGKIVDEGISIEPPIDGEWRWASENRLRFQPSDDWPAGQDYTVRYEPSLFAPNLEFDDLEANFSTPAFAAKVEELEFYQDPVKANVRKVVATLRFSHPVDDASLREHVRYTMRPTGTTIDDDAEDLAFDVRFGPLKRQAFIHSSPIDIPPEENYMTMHVGKGLAPADGPSRQTEDLLENVRIPSIGSYFRVDRVDAVIARNEDDDPVQTLTIQFTDRVQTARLQKRLRAFLLPKNAIIDGIEYKNRRWQSPREVDRQALAKSEPLDLTLSPVEGDSASLHSAILNVPEGRAVYLGIAAGLTSDGEFELSRSYDTLVWAPAYPREVKIAQSGAVLPLTGSHRLTFISRGLSTLKVELGRLHEDDVNHLASQTAGDLASPYFTNYQFNEDNVTSRVTRYIDVNEDAPGKASFSNLDLTEYLPDGGYYFVTIQGWDREHDYAVGGSDRRFVLVTDLGLLVKSNLDNTHDVFVHSIADGQAIAGATVDVLGRNGVAIFTRTTGADGHAALPTTAGFERERTPTVFVVRHGDDAVFMPYARHTRMLQYSRFDVGGEYASVRRNDERLRSQLFTDRGIYRPGDTIKLAAIVKRDDWGRLGNVPLRLKVIDPRGQLALDRKLQLPDGGFLEQAFDTEAASPTGGYRVSLYLIDDEHRQMIGDASFKVEEFLPDRLRIRSTIGGHKTVGWIKPGNLTADVRLTNLFGTPAQSRRVAGELELTPSRIRLQAFDGFVFDDPLRQPGTSLQAIRETLPDALTDDNGRASLPLDLSRYVDGIYRLSVTTEGFEEGGGRSVKARATAMVSPLDYLIGHKSDTDLGFLSKSSKHAIDLIAVDSDGKTIGLDNLTVSISEFRYVSSLIQRPNGTYAYQSIRKEMPVSSEHYAIAEQGSRYSLPTSQPGSFAMTVTDADGTVFSKIEFTIAGARNLAGNLERNAELALNLNGRRFDPGEEIELEITAPYTGTGLITIERDRVYAHQWIRSDSSTSVHRIRVPAGLEGNAYVNVAFVRDLGSPEIYVSPLSYAVAPFSVNRSARTVDIGLEAPALVRPGDRLDVVHRSSQPSKIVVYAVDEGILQVARYRTPDPLSHFLPKMALQVSTYQLVDLILPDFDAFVRSAAPGGGEAAVLAGSNLNPFRRKTDAPVAFWSGIVDSGPDPQTVSFDIPDYFNGQLRIMAVAAADTAVGSQQEATTVRAPFVLSPNVATAVAPGDEFEINVGLANALENSGESAAIDLTVTTSPGLEIVGDASIELTVGEGDEGRARFRVRALDAPGSASLSFVAKAGGESATSTATLSIRPPVAYVATMQSGSASDDPLTLSFSRDIYKEFGHQSAAASASPLILTDGLLDYLDAFPHACAEQIVSKVFPQIGFLGNADAAVDEGKLRQLLSNTVTKLRSRQGPEGGFRFWATSREPANFPSAYILHFLTDAGEKSLPIPDDMLDAGLDFLSTLAAAPVDNLPSARLRAYAIYVLTRNGTITTNYLTHLHEQLERDHKNTWRSDLVSAYMAASYSLLQKTRLGDDLIRGYEFGGGDEMYSDFDTRLGRDAQYLYLLAKHFPDRVQDIDARTIENITKPVMKNRFNTLSSAYTILALGAYTETVFDGAAPELRVIAEEPDGQRLLADAARFARATVDTDTRNVGIAGAGSNAVYYVLSQTGFDRSPPADALAEGLELHKEYLDRDGKAVTSARIGDELTVRLRVRSTGRLRTNVAVVDLLPGGFEVISDSLRRQHGGWAADYHDVREDRVVVYGSFTDRLTELQYRVKVTSAGSFIAPSAFAGSMYDRDIQARTRPGRFDVRPIP